MRQALLEATVAVAGERGLIDTSIARIVERAGLSSGSFYYYFESRQDILRALMPYINEKMLSESRAKIPAANSIEDLLRKRFIHLENAYRSHPSYLRICVEIRAYEPALYQEAMQHLAKSETQLMHSLAPETEHSIKDVDMEFFQGLVSAILISVLDHLHMMGGRRRSSVALAIEAAVSGAMGAARTLGIDTTTIPVALRAAPITR